MDHGCKQNIIQYTKNIAEESNKEEANPDNSESEQIHQEVYTALNTTKATVQKAETKLSY